MKAPVMKTPFDEWFEGYDPYATEARYAESAFYGGMQYALNLINNSMPPETSAAISDIVRENSEGRK